jgi:hypothetical protein
VTGSTDEREHVMSPQNDAAVDPTREPVLVGSVIDELFAGWPQ